MRIALLAPLALLIAPAAVPAQEATPAPARQPAQRIEIVLSNFKFTPDIIQLKAGQAYVLHLSSKGSHNLDAPEFFAAAKVDPNDRWKIPDGQIEVRTDAPVDIHFTAPAHGNFKIRCTHTMHSTFGMTGEIIVT
jgi:plastocyanin